MQKLAQENYLKAILSAIYQLNHYLDFGGKSDIPLYMYKVVTKMMPVGFGQDDILNDIKEELNNKPRIRRSGIRYLKHEICHEIYLSLGLAVESGCGFEDIQLAVESGLAIAEPSRINRPRLISALANIIEKREREQIWAKKSSKAWRRRERSKAKQIAQEGSLQMLSSYCELAQACVVSDDKFKNHIFRLLNYRGIKPELKIS